MKKIISIISVVSFTLLFITSSFTVYADTTSGAMTKQEYYAAQSWLISEWCDGKITYDDYKAQSESVTNRFIEENSVGTVPDAILTEYNNAVNITRAIGEKIGTTVEKYGSAAASYVKDAVSDLFGDYKTSEQVSTTDMHGYGAKVERFMPDGTPNMEYYCDYIVINPDYYSKEYPGKNYLLWTFHGSVLERSYRSWNDTWIETRYDKYNYSCNNVNSSLIYKFYGDIRYSDGSQAPTNDEYGTITKYDFTQKPDPENPDNTIPTTEQELAELLDEINEELERLNPDLTTTDEILKSIYYRLGELDSDNDNELLSDILSAINSIKNNSADTDNSDLLKTLEEIKKSLVFEDGENSATLAEELKQIIDNQLTADDFTIDEESYSNNGEILKLRLLGKFSFITELKDFVTYVFETYKNSSDTPKISMEIYGESYLVDMELFKEYLPLVQSILAASIYISYGYHTYRKIPSYINGGDNE